MQLYTHTHTHTHTHGNLLIKIGVAAAIVIVAIVIALIWNSNNKPKKIRKFEPDGEIARSMTYEEVQDGDENVVGTDYVKFDAFFLRDLDGDGYAESIRGSCREIGKTDTLYMELKVEENGFLENGIITINGNNFDLQTALPKDNEIKENVVGNNIREIKFNNINKGTQKLVTGAILSDIGSDTTNYSKTNSVTLKGTHVAEDGTKTEIEKEVQFNIDWHGTTKTQIPTYIALKENLNREQDINTAINEENQTFTVEHQIGIQEINNKLQIKKAYVETIIPDLGEISPIRVEVENTDVTYTYDEQTKLLTMQKEAEVNEEGIITKNAYDSIYKNNRYNLFKIKIVYPLEAFIALGDGTVRHTLDVSGYYEGFNNSNIEFSNPYKSIVEKQKFITLVTKLTGSVARFDVSIGKRIYTPIDRYVVSKDNALKLYNGIPTENVEDIYTVTWTANTGSEMIDGGITMKETKKDEEQESDQFVYSDRTTASMEEVTTNIGIYFNSATNMLGEDGWIKVYDEETNELIETFTKENWDKYSSNNPYIYKTSIKHIRIETSKANIEKRLQIGNIKKLDDEAIYNSYTKEDFDNITYIKSKVNGYIGDIHINTGVNDAYYEAPYARAITTINKSALSTQETEKNIEITIQTQSDEKYQQVKWQNGTFLIEMPKGILDIDISSVQTDKDEVRISSYEKYVENGINYIKINTENDTPQSFNIKISCDITVDPRRTTETGNLILYSYNQIATNYWNQAKDIYDIDGNLNTDEMIGKETTVIKMIAPSTILTNQSITNYDKEGSIAVAPQIAVIDKEQRTADINLEIKNNASNLISEVVILGRIPFENNKYAHNDTSMESTFTTTMTSAGIIIPEELQGKVTVYYSENGEATKDLADENNGWTTTPQDFSKVKSYLIDMQDYILGIKQAYTFSYQIEIPEGLNYNQISYSHYAVYFAIHTAEGKYLTNVIPNKAGLMVAKKYNIELTKYQKNTSRIVPGATYSIKEEGKEEGRTRVTNLNGKFVLDDIYVGKTYILREIKTPTDYELNLEEVKFVATEENGEIKLQIISGTVKRGEAIQPQNGQGYKIEIDVEDEVRAGLKILKTEKETDIKIPLAQFKITGQNWKAGRMVTTDTNGEISLKGLSVGEEYTLEEIKAEGYYLSSPIKFVIENNNGNYIANIIEGQESIKSQQETEENNIPIINLNIENEKIPRYNLQINKVVKGETTPLPGVKFRLFKGNKEINDYRTNEDGIITINDLYQYEEVRGIDQTYTLKEIYAPVGYSTIKDITFKVGKNAEGLLIMDVQEGKIKEQTVGENNTIIITIENSKSFKLIKSDGETGEVLPNTKFAIYNIDNGTQEIARDSKNNILGTKEIINGKEYYVVATDEKGEISADLKEGLYKAIEIQPSHEKYELTNSTYYFGIGASREGKVTWEPTKATSIGDPGYNDLYALTSTSDGGYAINFRTYKKEVEIDGNKYMPVGGEYDPIVKYNKNGNAEWVVWGDVLRNGIEGTTDGGLVAGGSKFVRKYSSAGEIEWTNNLESEGYTGKSIRATRDNGCIVTAESSSSSESIIRKYSSTGEVEWTKIFPRIGIDEYNALYSIVETKDDGYIIGTVFHADSVEIDGNVFTKPSNGRLVIIIKFSKDGEIKWANSIEWSSTSGYSENLIETTDGGYIATGTFYSTIKFGENELTYPGENGYVIKYTSTGEIEWFDIIEGQGISDAIKTRDNGCIITGRSGAITKYSSTGQREWEKNNSAKFPEIIEKDDGNYIVFSYTNSEVARIEGYTFAPYSQYFIELNTNGKIISTGSLEVNDSEGYCWHPFLEMQDGSILIVGEYWYGNIQIGDTLLECGEDDNNNLAIVKMEKLEIGDPVTTNAKSIGESGEESITTVVSTKDGGYIAGGYYTSNKIKVNDDISMNNQGESDGMIIKYTASGDVEWAMSIGGEKEDKITSIAKTSDNGYIVGGYYTSNKILLGEHELLNSVNSSNGMVIKISETGEVEWAKSIGGAGSDKVTAVTQVKDGGYIIGGQFSSERMQVGKHTVTNNGETNGIIIKYREDGEEEWVRTVGNEKNDVINSVAETKSGGFIVGGAFSSERIQIGKYVLENKGNSDGIVIRYSETGDVEWATSIGEEEADYISSVVESNDEGCAVGVNIGKYDPYNHRFGWDNCLIEDNEQDSVLIKYNKKGNEEWRTQIRGEKTESINSVVTTSDGGYLVGGNFNSSYLQAGEYPFDKRYILGNSNYYEEDSYNDGYIIQYNSGGNVVWTKTIGRNKAEQERK